MTREVDRMASFAVQFPYESEYGSRTFLTLLDWTYTMLRAAYLDRHESHENHPAKRSNEETVSACVRRAEQSTLQEAEENLYMMCRAEHSAE